MAKIYFLVNNPHHLFVFWMKMGTVKTPASKDFFSLFVVHNNTTNLTESLTLPPALSKTKTKMLGKCFYCIGYQCGKQTFAHQVHLGITAPLPPPPPQSKNTNIYFFLLYFCPPLACFINGPGRDGSVGHGL